MKKLFTLIVLCAFAITTQAAIHIYVKCETAPFIWWWGADGGLQNADKLASWPGTFQLTDKYTHPDTQEEFWMYTFPEEVTIVSFLFNDGAASGTKQTGNVENAISDRYFELAWDDGTGSVGFTDITEDYVEIPDAHLTSLGISGNHNDWALSTDGFTEVTPGTTYTYSVNPSTLGVTGAWTFKFRPNGSAWLGYNEVAFDGGAAPEWLTSNDGNFKIDLGVYSADAFNFTLTWAGGKELTSGWTITATADNLQKHEAGEKTWTVAGDLAICGSEWNPADTENDMTKGTDGLFRLVRTGVVISGLEEPKDFGFKVVANHAWGEEYGKPGTSDNQLVNIAADGTYDIEFTFNEETKETGATATVSTGIKTVSLKSAKTAAIYNLQGQRIDQNYRGIAIMDGKKVVLK